MKTWAARLRNRYILLTDLICIVISVWASFALAVGWKAVLPTYAPALVWMLGLALLTKPLVYYLFGLYRRLWIYASMAEVKVIAMAVSLASLIVGTVMLVLFYSGVFTGLPRSAIGIDWLISLLLVGGARFMLRLLAESGGLGTARPGATRHVLIVGAGDAGALVVRELQKNRQMNLIPEGFLDDDPANSATKSMCARHRYHPDLPPCSTPTGGRGNHCDPCAGASSARGLGRMQAPGYSLPHHARHLRAD
jgi:FlaA1/EpsC-like NDP-sugar epimerase